jgi:hypothetical protein
MKKSIGSRLDAHREDLEMWFEVEKISAKEAIKRLAKKGCSVCDRTLYAWWRKRRSKLLEERMLTQLGEAGKQCAELEKAFEKNPAPEIETLIKLHRVMALKLSNEVEGTPEIARLVAAIMKPLLEWQRIEEQRLAREAAEKERQREREEKEAEAEKLAAGEGGLRPETLEKIERELGLG